MKYGIIFFAVFQNGNGGISDRSKLVTQSKSPTTDFYKWINEQRAILEDKNNTPYVVINCKIIY